MADHNQKLFPSAPWLPPKLRPAFPRCARLGCIVLRQQCDRAKEFVGPMLQPLTRGLGEINDKINLPLMGLAVSQERRGDSFSAIFARPPRPQPLPSEQIGAHSGSLDGIVNLGHILVLIGKAGMGPAALGPLTGGILLDPRAGLRIDPPL